MSGRWRICIEAGGTFTDGVAVAPSGEARRAKVLSSGVIRGRVLNVAASAGQAAEIHGLPNSERLDLRGMTIRVVGGGALGVHQQVERAGLITGHAGRVVTVEPSAALGLTKGAIVEVGTGESATVLAARLLTGAPAGRPLPPADVRLATTWATNALLERRLTPTVLFVTRGFGDLLLIGDQRRPDLFALDIRRDPPVVTGVVEVGGRLKASGDELRPLELDAAVEQARAWLARGVRSAAVALLHSWRNPEHEQRLGAALAQAGFEHVSLSSQLSPRMRLLARARTAVVNAALSGAVGGFVRGARAGWGGRAGDGDPAWAMQVMTSAGGLCDAASFAAKDSLLSGPAGGVCGARAIAARAGLGKVIAFDMGGTSTDVTRIDGAAELTVTHRVAATELMAPALAVHSVAAGGGSICGLELIERAGAAPVARPVVGPRSAGADPGPACYGRGGPLTLTDVNLLLGRLDPATFKIPVDADAARVALRAVREGAMARGAELPGEEALLEGFVRLADERMAQAIRVISVRKGYDPREYALVAFGGAGGQHACAVAGELGIRTVVIPGECSVLSALGLHAAAAQVVKEEQTLAPLNEHPGGVAEAFQRLAGAAEAELRARGERAARITRTARLRYRGQDHALDLPWTPGTDLGAAFEERSRVIFGHVIPGRAVEVESLRVVAEGPEGDGLEGQVSELQVEARREARVFLHGAWRRAPVLAPAALGAGSASSGGAEGPMLVVMEGSIAVVPSGWRASLTPRGDLRLDRSGAEPAVEAASGAAAVGAAGGWEGSGPAGSEIEIELMGGRLESLGEAMGELLGRTALSTSVKERLDYSCALLDAQGRLVVSAPHVPVHLGALGVCVRLLRGAAPMAAGDVVFTNHPGFGGSHLPDVTLVAPAFDDAGVLIGYAACRAHHAEIGGTRPGSMPPDARCLAEEGVVIRPTLLARGAGAGGGGKGEAAGVGGGVPDWEGVRRMFTQGPHPTRAIDDNLADLAAQLAAVRMGVDGLARAARERGSEAVGAAMASLLARAEAHASAAVARCGLPDGGEVWAESRMDDGWPLRAALRRTGHRLTIDFSGSGPVHPGNLNAPLAVTYSAVMYAIRLLVTAAAGGGRPEGRDEPLSVPLNDGLMGVVDLILPEGLLDPPFASGSAGAADDPSRLPAVAGGNVETSQRVVNLLLRALGLLAESQGTMNNLLFGDARLGYYETLGGGAGAGPGFDGASGVHTHMTNTAITDPEVLEHRYPVRLDRFAIRPGSGGAGVAGPGGRGGDGLVRELTFLAPLSVSLLTSSRVTGPVGMRGGSAGAPGRQCVIRAGGAIESLPSVAAVDVEPGDQLIVETPGGGGWGDVPSPDAAQPAKPAPSA